LGSLRKAYNSEKSFSNTSTDHQELKKEVSEKTLVVTKDSAGSELTTIIWPRGYFRFSTENGFTGEADKIQLTHKKSTKSKNLKRVERHVQQTPPLLKRQRLNQPQA